MNSLMAPAIALMNRLGYGMKFCLISVLFFIPLGIVSSMLVQQAYDRVELTQHALDSMALLRQNTAILRDAEALRDLDMIYVQLGQGEYAQDLEQRTQVLRKSVIDGLNGLALDADDPEAADLLAKRDELVNVYQGIAGESVRNRGAMSTQALGEVSSLLSFSAAYAGLPQDYDRNIRQLSDLLINVTPNITSSLGNGRSVGAYSIGLGYLNSDASRDMDDLFEAMQRLRSDYEQVLALVLADSSLTGLQSYSQASLESLDEAIRIFEDDIILANSLSGTWSDYFAQLTSEIDKTYAFNQEMLDTLAQVLEQRMAENFRSMMVLIVSLSLVGLLIIYLYAGFYMATRRTLKRLSVLMGQVAGGDMTVQVEVDSRDELGALASEFNDTVERIRELIRQVSQTAGEVHQQSQQVESISSESSHAVASQRSQIEQVATAMNEMSATSQEVARSAALAVTSAEQVNTETLNGRKLVESSVEGIGKLAGEIENSVKVINKLADDSSSISRVLEVIKGVAEQTNLLALNAAIEAARAGEQGRGFAVVADEVRTLARRTQQSTEEIEQMIARLQEGVSGAVKAMGASHGMTGSTVEASLKVQEALGNILKSVTQIVDQSQQIAAAAEEQTAVSHDIDHNIVQINQTGERTAEGARQAEQSSNRMGQLVKDLQHIISAFRV
ncbi:methyl-accepting chemotaxis protein [Halopseudomonas laoshanensis]|uniref:Methyl-accepting chemotaxis protein n=1 Tax=Halopseudomonas laoshanensis TaxID=2268758 RepID=A0A7V7KY43_9GAMM|nr:methyl-accepting chemotaxis protein [Halopseudomonas laoshanensis]KAA0695804.1 methyl-accepting chemotaxis protein [Halopseudomonas laoshanensis]MBQ0743598.1 methyl-accepting chemotaxis protein [Pseudomonas sp.]MBQ0778289.1 methyl-accepting chemotaxis protein [Pseudomonas sp.]